MSSASGPPGDSLPLSVEQHIDAVCLRFEKDWQAGRQPPIEPYLAEGSPEARATLLRELVALELAYRRRSGDTPAPEEYYRRFPEHSTLLKDVLEAAAGGTSTSPDSPPAPGLSALAAVGARYRPVRAHARGGLGEVHVAEDMELRREVALKRIQERYADDPESRRRFLREAEITGRLEHPGVVPVYGLVQDAAGQPSYAMRFVQGETLRDAIRRFHTRAGSASDEAERRLALRELLGRFVAVCKTVAYAHSRGVLHRDLKPANVMLGQYGETLVVDWGLAKVFERSDVERPTGEDTSAPRTQSGPDGDEAGTRAGMVAGTPTYMSPEQAAGRWDEVGPASDIYSLGATLYELLVNRPPVEGSSHEQVLERARRGEFMPPRQVNRDVPRALEAICLKALAFAPGERYATATELAGDVEHWLADEPVSAYREPWTVRGGRWVKRHRLLVTGTAAALLVGLVGLAVGAALLGRTNRQLVAANEQAVRARDRAFHVLDAMTSDVIGQSLATQQAISPEQKKLLAEVLTYYEELAEEQGEDEGTRKRIARAAHGVGLIHYRLGDRQSAGRALARGQDFLRQLHAEDPTDLATARALAWSHLNLGVLHGETGQAQQAETAYKAALAVGERLHRDHPTDATLAQDLAACHNNLGEMYKATGRPKEAETAHESALALRLRVYSHDRESVTHTQQLALSYHNLGHLYDEQNRNAEAERAYQRARTLRQRLYEAHPTTVAYAQELARTRANQGNLLRKSQRWEPAGAALAEARELFQKLHTQRPTVREHASDLATAITNLGYLYYQTQRRQEALATYQEAVSLLRPLHEEFPKVTWYAYVLGCNLDYIGLLTSDLGRPEESLAHSADAIAVLGTIFARGGTLPPARFTLGLAHLNRARALKQLGRRPEAAQDWARVLELYDGSPYPPWQALSAAALANAGEHAQAVATVERLVLVAGKDSEMLYACACVYALAAEAATDDPALRKQYADRAVKMLRQAVDIGFMDGLRVQKDEDLAELRPRDDFKGLVEKLNGKP